MTWFFGWEPQNTSLVKGPLDSPQPHSSPAMVMPEAEENSQISSHRRGKLVMGFSEKVPPYARTLSLPCARISHSTGQKKNVKYLNELVS